MKEFNVIYIVGDGITTLLSGVGSIARSFIFSFPEVRKKFKDTFGLNLKLHVVTFGSGEKKLRSGGTYANIQDVIKQSQGSLIEVPWPKELSEDYFNFSTWRSLNNKVGMVINSLEVDNKLILANDLIFGLIQPNPGDKLLFIPHSLHKVHNQDYVDSKQRQAWEDEVFACISEREGSYIGYLNGYVKKLLEGTYGLDPQKFIPAITGLSFAGGLKHPNTANLLDKYTIPADKNLIVAISRADTYKGLEITVDAMQKFLHNHNEFHGVMVAARFSDEPHLLKYLESLRGKAKSDRITFIDQFDPLLPRQLFEYSKTKILMSLPPSDLAPLVPLEAAAFSHNGLAIVVSDAECFKEVFVNGETAFVAGGGSDAILQLLSRLAMPSTQPLIEQVNKKSKQVIRTRYDLGANTFESISTLAFGSTKNF